MRIKIRNLFSVLLFGISIFNISATDCELAIGIDILTGEGDKVPVSITRKLEAKLKMILTHTGIVADDYACQFFITGRFDEAFSTETGGVGGRVLVKSDLQLAICDGTNKKVFATATFPLKGVGATDEQALTKALGSLNAKNPEFINFVDKAKYKIIDYFNKNYPMYLQKAQTALTQRNYDEALYWVMEIPECCVGYNEAHILATTIYNDRIEYEGKQLLAKAEGEWATNPTAKGAQVAYSYLIQIDPATKSYAAAKDLGAKMTKSVKADFDFETKEKYRDQVALEKQRVQAAKEIGIAWAKSQPKTVVKHNWIVW